MRARDYHLPEIPHWHKVTAGEPRWPISFVVALVIILQYTLPAHYSLKSQKWICLGEVLLALALFAWNPGRIKGHKQSRWYLGIALSALMTLSNVASSGHLVRELLNGSATSPTSLLAAGGSIWLTNIIAFSLWYWEFDRGGPGARAQALDPYPDFLFPQMESPQLAPADWAPNYFDYLYISFTNASAFSPTDVLPLSRWAKTLMTIQSTTSLVTVGLVIARAVNILK
jgi:uncharacterized membrane protein